MNCKLFCGRKKKISSTQSLLESANRYMRKLIRCDGPRETPPERTLSNGQIWVSAATWTHYRSFSSSCIHTTIFISLNRNSGIPPAAAHFLNWLQWWEKGVRMKVFCRLEENLTSRLDLNAPSVNNNAHITGTLADPSDHWLIFRQ